MIDFIDRFSPIRMIVLAAAVFIGFAFLWYAKVYTDPERAFNSMLENSLRINGAGRHVTQSDSGQDLDQYTHLSLGDTQAAEAKIRLVQAGGLATVLTESIGTPSEDYVRYTSIETSQTNAAGQPLDFSGVLNVWGSNGEDFDSNVTDGELYNESVLGVVPFGNLPKQKRAGLLKTIRDENIYEVDYGSVVRESRGIRPYYTYSVAIDAEKYVRMLKQFGEAVGFNHLGSLDPAAYAGSEKLQFKLTVDVWARQLSKIVYGGGERTEELSGHNAVRPVTLPADAISVDELQSRLQQLQ